MIPGLSIWVNILFGLTFLATLYFFYISNNKPKRLVVFVFLWSLIHGGFAYTGFYKNTQSLPPRLFLVLLPAVGIISYSLLSKHKETVLANRNITLSTFLHSFRLPIELILLQLFVHKMIPELMTFEGRNFDIIAGLTAPIVGWLYLKNKLSTKWLLVWNYVSLALVLFILFNAILSVEFPLQQFAFDQPNKAITYFPFILLPATIVPIVIWTHITDIILLRRKLKRETIR